MSERIAKREPARIERSEYADVADALKHVFLVGDLRRETPHPFFQDDRFEFMLCFYRPNDDGDCHWHAETTEYALVIEGRVGYLDATTGTTHWYDKGDLVRIPAGTCTKRIVPEATQLVAVKVPSRPGDRHYCDDCPYGSAPNAAV